MIEIKRAVPVNERLCPLRQSSEDLLELRRKDLFVRQPSGMENKNKSVTVTLINYRFEREKRRMRGTRLPMNHSITSTLQQVNVSIQIP